VYVSCARRHVRNSAHTAPTCMSHRQPGAQQSTPLTPTFTPDHVTTIRGNTPIQTLLITDNTPFAHLLRVAPCCLVKTHQPQFTGHVTRGRCARADSTRRHQQRHAPTYLGTSPARRGGQRNPRLVASSAKRNSRRQAPMGAAKTLLTTPQLGPLQGGLQQALLLSRVLVRVRQRLRRAASGAAGGRPGARGRTHPAPPPEAPGARTGTPQRAGQGLPGHAARGAQRSALRWARAALERVLLECRGSSAGAQPRRALGQGRPARGDVRSTSAGAGGSAAPLERAAAVLAAAAPLRSRAP